MSNDLSGLTDSALHEQVTTAQNVLKVSAVSYGILPADATLLGTENDQFSTDIAAANAAKAAAKAAVQAKDAQRAELLSLFGRLVTTIYNNPAVTPAMIATLGLQPRSPKTAIVPQTPVSLVATPFANGDVELKWARGGNRYGVTYLIEVKEETGDWSQIFATTRTKIRLSGYAPGVPTWFRLKATKNLIVSGPSQEVSIYHDVQSVQLKVAA